MTDQMHGEGPRRRAFPVRCLAPAGRFHRIDVPMRIELRDENRERIGRLDVDPSLRPTRVTVVGTGREVFLDWEAALDDAGHMRRCVACGSRDLFRDKAFPQVTLFVVLLAFAGAVLGALGYATTPPMLGAMGVVLVLDVAILLFSKRWLVCYRCRTRYHGMPIAKYHRRWDRSVAERYPAPPRNGSEKPAADGASATRRRRGRRARRERSVA